MNPSRLLLLSLFLAFTPAAFPGETQWRKWPRGTQDSEASVRIPATFKVVVPGVKQSEKMLINGRFRSPDGAVEFAVAVTYVRGMERSVGARSISLPLLSGERVIARTPATRKVKSEYGDYVLYEEDITVERPKKSYTRYFRIELSTGSLSGASSCLWEFKAADERSQKAYQAIYRQFKKTLDLGNID